MYSVDKRLFHEILKKKFKSLVGTSCERIEEQEKRKEISLSATRAIIFDLKKDSYNTMREIEEQISSFSDGVKFNVTLQKPSS